MSVHAAFSIELEIVELLLGSDFVNSDIYLFLFVIPYIYFTGLIDNKGHGLIDNKLFSVLLSRILYRSFTKLCNIPTYLCNITIFS